MPHMSAFNKNTQKGEFSDMLVLFESLLKGGRRREAEGGGGHTDRMFCLVWTMLQIGANSNRPVQSIWLISVGHYRPQPQQHPLKSLFSNIVDFCILCTGNEKKKMDGVGDFYGKRVRESPENL